MLNQSINVAAKKNAHSESVGAEGTSHYEKHVQQERGEQCDAGSEDAAVAAAEQKHVKVTVKDAPESSDANHGPSWLPLPGWNLSHITHLSSITQLTGAVKSTVIL